MLKPAIEEVRG
jgi:hypothetical protein